MNANQKPASRFPRLLTLALLITLLIALLGCGEDNDSSDNDAAQGANPPEDFSGVWNGTLLADSDNTFGEVSLTVDQNNRQVDGVWGTLYVDVHHGGTLAGGISSNGHIVTLTLTPSNQQTCPLRVTVDIQGNEAHGNYATVSCPVLATGVVHVYRNTAISRYDPIPPFSPTGLDVIPGDGEATLTWGNAAGATGYNLYWSTSPGVNKATGIKVARVMYPFTLKGLANGTPHYFILTATNMGGESDISQEVTATPAIGLPIAEPPPNDPPLPGTSTNPEAGLWVAPQYTGGTAKIELTVSVDASGNARWTVHGWGFCGGGYCDWGTTSASRLANGDIYGIWDFGWKTTEVWARLSTTRPGQLETYMWHDYLPPDTRTDRGGTEYFVPSP